MAGSNKKRKVSYNDQYNLLYEQLSALVIRYTRTTNNRILTFQINSLLCIAWVGGSYTDMCLYYTLLALPFKEINIDRSDILAG